MTAKELKKLRESVGLSVNECARQVHIASRSWARYEDGTRPIPAGVVELLCIKNGIVYKREDVL
jgi:predicted transcriptional regulator